MKISQRLVALVATAVTALVVVAAINLFETAHVYTKANLGNTVSVPSLVEINKAVMALGRMRVRLYRFALLEDAAEEAKLLPKLMAGREDLDTALKTGAALAADQEERDYNSREVSMLAEYYAGMDRTVAAVTRHDHKAAVAELLHDADLAQKISVVFDERLDTDRFEAKARTFSVDVDQKRRNGPFCRCLVRILLQASDHKTASLTSPIGLGFVPAVLPGVWAALALSKLEVALLIACPSHFSPFQER